MLWRLLNHITHTRHWSNIGLLLDQLRRRWTNITRHWLYATCLLGWTTSVLYKYPRVLKVIYHPLYGMNNYDLIWGDWLSCDPLKEILMPHLVATLIYLSQIYSYYIRGDMSPLISNTQPSQIQLEMSGNKTLHYIIFFVRPLHSKPGMESYCSLNCSLWRIFSMVGSILTQLKPSELYILSVEKRLGLRHDYNCFYFLVLPC